MGGKEGGREGGVGYRGKDENHTFADVASIGRCEREFLFLRCLLLLLLLLLLFFLLLIVLLIICIIFIFIDFKRGGISSSRPQHKVSHKSIQTKSTSKEKTKPHLKANSHFLHAHDRLIDRVQQTPLSYLCSRVLNAITTFEFLLLAIVFNKWFLIHTCK